MNSLPIQADWSNRLDRGLDELNLTIEPHAKQRLLSLVGLLMKWNQAYNLTAVTEPLEMIDRHLLDSLTLAPYLHGTDHIDVGTGAGFPGLPLAMVGPQQNWLLLDSNNKKIRFVRHAILQLGLKNVRAIHQRIESFHTEQVFDGLVCRAFASLEDIIKLTAGVRAARTRIYAMKGKLERADAITAAAGYRTDIHKLKTPFSSAERHLILLTPNNAFSHNGQSLS